MEPACRAIFSHRSNPKKLLPWRLRLPEDSRTRQPCQTAPHKHSTASVGAVTVAVGMHTFSHSLATRQLTAHLQPHSGLSPCFVLPPPGMAYLHPPSATFPSIPQLTAFPCSTDTIQTLPMGCTWPPSRLSTHTNPWVATARHHATSTSAVSSRPVPSITAAPPHIPPDPKLVAAMSKVQELCRQQDASVSYTLQDAVDTIQAASSQLLACSCSTLDIVTTLEAVSQPDALPAVKPLCARLGYVLLQVATRTSGGLGPGFMHRTVVASARGNAPINHLLKVLSQQLFSEPLAYSADQVQGILRVARSNQHPGGTRDHMLLEAAADSLIAQQQQLTGTFALQVLGLYARWPYSQPALFDVLCSKVMEEASKVHGYLDHEGLVEAVQACAFVGHRHEALLELTADRVIDYVQGKVKDSMARQALPEPLLDLAMSTTHSYYHLRYPHKRLRDALSKVVLGNLNRLVELHGPEVLVRLAAENALLAPEPHPVMANRVAEAATQVMQQQWRGRQRSPVRQRQYPHWPQQTTPKEASVNPGWCARVLHAVVKLHAGRSRVPAGTSLTFSQQEGTGPASVRAAAAVQGVDAQPPSKGSVAISALFAEAELALKTQTQSLSLVDAGYILQALSTVAHAVDRHPSLVQRCLKDIEVDINSGLWPGVDVTGVDPGGRCFGLRQLDEAMAMGETSFVRHADREGVACSARHQPQGEGVVKREMQQANRELSLSRHGSGDATMESNSSTGGLKEADAQNLQQGNADTVSAFPKRPAGLHGGVAAAQADVATTGTGQLQMGAVEGGPMGGTVGGSPQQPMRGVSPTQNEGTQSASDHTQWCTHGAQVDTVDNALNPDSAGQEGEGYSKHIAGGHPGWDGTRAGQGAMPGVDMPGGGGDGDGRLTGHGADFQTASMPARPQDRQLLGHKPSIHHAESLTVVQGNHVADGDGRAQMEALGRQLYQLTSVMRGLSMLPRAVRPLPVCEGVSARLASLLAAQVTLEQVEEAQVLLLAGGDLAYARVIAAAGKGAGRATITPWQQREGVSWAPDLARALCEVQPIGAPPSNSATTAAVALLDWLGKERQFFNLGMLSGPQQDSLRACVVRLGAGHHPVASLMGAVGGKMLTSPEQHELGVASAAATADIAATSITGQVDCCAVDRANASATDSPPSISQIIQWVSVQAQAGRASEGLARHLVQQHILTALARPPPKHSSLVLPMSLISDPATPKHPSSSSPVAALKERQPLSITSHVHSPDHDHKSEDITHQDLVALISALSRLGELTLLRQVMAVGSQRLSGDVRQLSSRQVVELVDAFGRGQVAVNGKLMDKLIGHLESHTRDLPLSQLTQTIATLAHLRARTVKPHTSSLDPLVARLHGVLLPVAAFHLGYRNFAGSAKRAAAAAVAHLVPLPVPGDDASGTHAEAMASSHAMAGLPIEGTGDAQAIMGVKTDLATRGKRGGGTDLLLNLQDGLVALHMAQFSVTDTLNKPSVDDLSPSPGSQCSKRSGTGQAKPAPWPSLQQLLHAANTTQWQQVGLDERHQALQDWGKGLLMSCQLQLLQQLHLPLPDQSRTGVPVSDVPQVLERLAQTHPGMTRSGMLFAVSAKSQPASSPPADMSATPATAAMAQLTPLQCCSLLMSAGRLLQRPAILAGEPQLQAATVQLVTAAAGCLAAQLQQEQLEQLDRSALALPLVQAVGSVLDGSWGMSKDVQTPRMLASKVLVDVLASHARKHLLGALPTHELLRLVRVLGGQPALRQSELWLWLRLELCARVKPLASSASHASSTHQHASTPAMSQPNPNQAASTDVPARKQEWQQRLRGAWPETVSEAIRLQQLRTLTGTVQIWLRPAETLWAAGVLRNNLITPSALLAILYGGPSSLALFPDKVPAPLAITEGSHAVSGPAVLLPEASMLNPALATQPWQQRQQQHLSERMFAAEVKHCKETCDLHTLFEFKAWTKNVLAGINHLNNLNHHGLLIPPVLIPTASLGSAQPASSLVADVQGTASDFGKAPPTLASGLDARVVASFEHLVQLGSGSRGLSVADSLSAFRALHALGMGTLKRAAMVARMAGMDKPGVLSAAVKSEQLHVPLNECIMSLEVWAELIRASVTARSTGDNLASNASTIKLNALLGVVRHLSHFLVMHAWLLPAPALQAVIRSLDSIGHLALSAEQAQPWTAVERPLDSLRTGVEQGGCSADRQFSGMGNGGYGRHRRAQSHLIDVGPALAMLREVYRQRNEGLVEVAAGQGDVQGTELACTGTVEVVKGTGMQGAKRCLTLPPLPPEAVFSVEPGSRIPGFNSMYAGSTPSQLQTHSGARSVGHDSKDLIPWEQLAMSVPLVHLPVALVIAAQSCMQRVVTSGPHHGAPHNRLTTSHLKDSEYSHDTVITQGRNGLGQVTSAGSTPHGMFQACLRLLSGGDQPQKLNIKRWVVQPAQLTHHGAVHVLAALAMLAHAQQQGESPACAGASAGADQTSTVSESGVSANATRQVGQVEHPDLGKQHRQGNIATPAENIIKQLNRGSMKEWLSHLFHSQLGKLQQRIKACKGAGGHPPPPHLAEHLMLLVDALACLGRTQHAEALAKATLDLSKAYEGMPKGRPLISRPEDLAMLANIARRP